MSDYPKIPDEIWQPSASATGSPTAPLPGEAAASASLPDPLDLPEKIVDDWSRLEPRRRLAEELRGMRRARGLSQREIAERIGLQQPAVARMESVAGPWPAQEAIAAFATACRKTAMLVFVDIEESTEPVTAQGSSPVLYTLVGAPVRIMKAEVRQKIKAMTGPPSDEQIFSWKEPWESWRPGSAPTTYQLHSNSETLHTNRLFHLYDNDAIRPVTSSVSLGPTGSLKKRQLIEDN